MSTEPQPHPETKPDIKPDENFLFSLQAGKPVLAALSEEISKLQQRVDYIVNNMEIKGITILSQLLQFTRDPEDLRKLGKCLERLADLIPELDELKKRKAVLDVAAENPMWLASVFGDFSAELDRLSEELDK